jgi:glycosyltransferase involved in cell wall biosynthesis
LVSEVLDTRLGPARGGVHSAPTVCLLGLSPIADDPRIRRQGDAFHHAGWNVVAVGSAGAKSPAPSWTIVAPSSPPPSGAAVTGGRDRKLLKRAARAALLLGVRLRSGLALRVFWLTARDVRRLDRLARAVRADVWLANDWPMLPLAARLARETGGVYGYDTHEFATEEYGEDPKWRLLNRPMIGALERAFIHDAVVVSAVSAGIAAQLDRMYKLRQPVIVVRNTPKLETTCFRPTGERIRVLYHGLIAAGRGLEASIDSVADWRPEFDLTLRGPGDAGFIAALQQRIAALGLARRISILPPLPMTELVREASAFDVGLFALPGTSRHNEFALPNKFFEYAMAGLALCVSDLPEMARLIRQYAMGVTIPAVAPAAIAGAINRLDRDTIDRCKRHALMAARELCWERESAPLVAAYEAAIGYAGRHV